MNTYHVRVHYRKTNAVSGRRVSWLPKVVADSNIMALRIAVERVVNRRGIHGPVEIVSVEVTEKEQINA